MNVCNAVSLVMVCVVVFQFGRHRGWCRGWSEHEKIGAWRDDAIDQWEELYEKSEKQSAQRLQIIEQLQSRIDRGYAIDTDEYGEEQGAL